MTVFDRNGRAWEVRAYEVEGLLASGAYFLNQDHREITMPIQDSSTVTIYDVATGKPLQRRPVDAKELVQSGRFSFKLAVKEAKPEPPQGTPPPDTGDPSNGPAALPILTEENSKEEILAALSSHGVQHRANLSKTDLLALWSNYVLEQGQK